MKRQFFVLCAMLGLCAAWTPGGVIFEASGISGKGVDVSFKAELIISGGMLTIQLINQSPVNSLNPDDVLSSFYFDIVNADGQRPSLTYTAATGDVYQAKKDGPDTLIESGANLKSLSGGLAWVFREMDESAYPYLGFGIGTVGNSNLTPNNFPGMNGVETSIYKGDVTTQPLHNKQLVKDTATFQFGGVTGFTEDDITRQFAFGLGTAPDSLLTPEPATLILLGLGGLLLGRKSR